MLLSPRDFLKLWADLGLTSLVSEASIPSFSLPVFPRQKECSPCSESTEVPGGTDEPVAPLLPFTPSQWQHSLSFWLNLQSFSTHAGDLTPQPRETAVQKEAASNTRFFSPPSQLSDHQTYKCYSPVCTHKPTAWKAGGTWKDQKGHIPCCTYTLSESGPSMYNQFKTARLEELFLLMPPGKHQKTLLGTIPADIAIVTASKAKKILLFTAQGVLIYHCGQN